MSEQTRAYSLSEAVKAIGSSGDAGEILALAEQFNSFLSQDNDRAAAPAAPAPAPVKTPKPAKVKAVEKKPEPVAEETEADEAEETEAAGPTGDDVKAVISKMIAEKQRDELVSLLKKFKATSFSGLKEADYAKFIGEGEQIVANAKLAQ